MVAEEEQTKKAKRRIRKVETVREKSEKATQSSETPRRRSAVWHGFTAPVRFAGRGLRKVGKTLGKFKFFRIIGLILWPPYFRNSWKELRQVTWPNRKQTRQLTIAVLIFASIFGVVVAVLDFGLDKLFKEVLLK